MKTTIIISLFILTGLLSNAQKVIYKPVFVNQCNQQIDSLSYFGIIGDSIYYSLKEYESTSIELPDTGKYQLEYSFDEYIDIHIKSFGFVSDTFFVPEINLVHYVSNPPHSEYFCCDTLCDGNVSDFYYHGHLRKQGEFKNGQPVDSLKRYYYNGSLESVFYPFKKRYKFAGKKYPEYLSIYYDKHGNCLHYKNTKKGVEKVYRPDGSIVSEFYFSKRKNDYTEYFENGVVKTRIDKKYKSNYYQNGQLKVHIDKYETFADRITSFFDRTSFRYFTYDFTQYDTLGNISSKGQFVSDNWEYVLSYGFPENLDSVPSNDFNEIVYVTNPKTKEVFDWELYYENNDYKGTKTIITVYELSENEWKEIDKREIVNRKFK